MRYAKIKNEVGVAPAVSMEKEFRRAIKMV